MRPLNALPGDMHKDTSETNTAAHVCTTHTHTFVHRLLSLFVRSRQPESTVLTCEHGGGGVSQVDDFVSVSSHAY